MQPPYSPANPGPPFANVEPQLIDVRTGAEELPELLCEQVLDLYQADQEAARAANACRPFQNPAYLAGSQQRQQLRDLQEEARSKSWAEEAIAADLRYRFSTCDRAVKVANAVSTLHERRSAWLRAWELLADFAQDHRPSEWQTPGMGKEGYASCQQAVLQSQQELYVAQNLLTQGMNILYAQCVSLQARRGHPLKKAS